MTTATQTNPTNFAGQLRQQTAAVKLKHRKLGVRKALSAVQRELAADVFHAERDAISAAKKLLNTKHEAYRKVTGVRRLATDYWRMLTVAYPEPGVRLIRRDRVDEFNLRMNGFREELDTAVAELEAVYEEMRAEARARLGDLFSSDDYPYSLRDEFGLAWEFPPIDPPAYLKALNPALYEAEQARIAARFDEAVRMAEEAFAVELADLVAHLCDRLSGGDDGKPKVFRDTAVENLQGFFQRFGELNIRSNAELDKLVEQAQQAVAGATPELLRKDQTLRQTVQENLAAVREEMDKLMVERPRRLIDLEE